MDSLQEIKVDNIQELIQNIECANIKNNKCKYILNGNFIDVIELIHKYSLKKDEILHFNEKFYMFDYQQFKALELKYENTFATGPRSMYGHVITKLKINNVNVEIRQSPKTNYEHKFQSKLIAKYDKQEYVVLDIETTGLDPLIDDVIQICIYESNDNKYVRYLPLEKQQKNTACNINRITNQTLKTKTSLTQEEVNNIIKQFNLENKLVMVWTGKNLFDRLFLEIYFAEHKLKGLEFFKFFNARTLLNKYEIGINDCSKDSIARLYGINSSNSHDALEDCKIEKEIIVNILNGNVAPLFADYENKIMKDVIEFFYQLVNNYELHVLHKNELTSESIAISLKLKHLYFKLCEVFKLKYGYILNDYDKNHKKRGLEWIDIHHVDEIETHNIGVRTQLAKMSNNVKEVQALSKYNKHDRLIYVNKVEHFILHAVLDVYKNYPQEMYSAQGIHYIFGDLIKLEIGNFYKQDIEFSWHKKRGEVYKHVSFEQILQIYISVCRYYNIKDIKPFIQQYWKLNDYCYDENKYEYFVGKINSQLNLDKEGL